MSKRKFFLKGMCLVMVLLMSSNVAYAVKTSSKTVKERDLNNNKDLKKAKDYIDILIQLEYPNEIKDTTTTA